MLLYLKLYAKRSIETGIVYSLLFHVVYMRFDAASIIRSALFYGISFYIFMTLYTLVVDKIKTRHLDGGKFIEPKQTRQVSLEMPAIDVYNLYLTKLHELKATEIDADKIGLKISAILNKTDSYMGEKIVVEIKRDMNYKTNVTINATPASESIRIDFGQSWKNAELFRQFVCPVS